MLFSLFLNLTLQINLELEFSYFECSLVSKRDLMSQISG